MNSTLLYVSNIFAVICKDLGVNYLMGTENLLYESTFTSRNSSNIDARSAPDFPRAIWISSFKSKYSYKGVLVYPNIRLRFCIPDNWFVEQQPKRTNAEKQAILENFAKAFWDKINALSGGLKLRISNENADISVEKYAKSGGSGSVFYWESLLEFGLQVVDCKAPLPVIAPTTPVDALYNPLATEFGNIPSDKDILNPDSY